MKKTLAIITARGGSKRIPKKNIKDFCGKPILAYSIEAAISSGCFDEVMVSTDSKEIADIAIKYGANVPFMRSERTSDDFATTADVLLEVLDKYKEIGKEFDTMCCIYPTAPFVTGEKIRMAVEMIHKSGEIKAVMPVVSFSYPPQRSYIINNNLLEMKWKENYCKRSQDLEKFYHDSGQFYVYDVLEYKEKQGLITENIAPIILDEMEVQDIDNETDWKLAELKYKLLFGEFELRNATKLDDKLLFDWSNNAVVRENSFNKNAIKWDEHKAWLSNKLLDENSKIMILTHMKHDVGVIRFDYCKNARKVMISYSISEEHRNKGYGNKIVDCGVKWLKNGAVNWDINVIEANVKISNIASKKIFISNGFIEKERDKEKILFSYSLE